MSKAFRTNIDLAGNQLLNALIQPAGSAPNAKAAGQIYYNTAGSLYYSTASGTGNWVQVATGSTALASLNGLTVATTIQGTSNQIAVTTLSPNITLSFPTAGVTLPGKTTLTASSTGGASLNIPTGAAPTSPNVGDVWLIQATGVQAQYGSSAATHTLADTDSSQTFTNKTLTTPILTAGTTSAAPIKFTPTLSALMTTPSAGNMEVDANGILYYTTASTRQSVALGNNSNTITLTTTGNTNVTLPTTGTLATTGQTFYLGTQAVAINASSGTITNLPGVSSVNGISLTPASTGFTVAGGTTSKTLTVLNTLTLSGTDSSTLNIGGGGTLGSAAFTASTAYAPSVGSTNIATVGTITAGTWNGTNIALGNGGTNATLTATAGGVVYSTASAMAISNAGTSGYLLTSAGTSAPTWTQSTATNVNDAVVQRDSSGNIAVSQVTVSADPAQALQVATKQYVDNIASGINAHDAVVAATTAALTATYNNNTSGIGATLTNSGTQAALVLDNVSVLAGDRVLVKNQASNIQNGIYRVTTVGTGSTNWVLTRASDYDQSVAGEVAAGDTTFVTAPVAQFSITPTQQHTGWIQNTPGTIVIGTSSITFVQGSGVGTVTAGLGIAVTGNSVAVSLGSVFDTTTGSDTTGLSLSSNTLKVRLNSAGGLTSTTAGLAANLGTGLTISGNAITFASGYGVRKYTGSITGDTVATSFPITHGLGTNDVTVRVYQTSTTGNPDTQYSDIEVDITRNTTNQVTIGFATAPAVAHTYNVVVIG